MELMLQAYHERLEASSEKENTLWDLVCVASVHWRWQPENGNIPNLRNNVRYLRWWYRRSKMRKGGVWECECRIFDRMSVRSKDILWIVIREWTGSGQDKRSTWQTYKVDLWPQNPGRMYWKIVNWELAAKLNPCFEMTLMSQRWLWSNKVCWMTERCATNLLHEEVWVWIGLNTKNVCSVWARHGSRNIGWKISSGPHKPRGWLAPRTLITQCLMPIQTNIVCLLTCAQIYSEPCPSQ